jgi:bifunctional ADP-heptose synthase (sugar kinase/adenylyltransferase)
MEPSGNRKRFLQKKVEVFDVSGAGDTFLASLVYGFVKSNCMETSLIFANKCASIVVQKSGTYALTLQDIVENDICL